MENIQTISFKGINNWLLLASFFSALTIITIKYYVIYSYNYWLLVTLLSSICVIYSYIQLLKKEDIVIAFALVKIISILFVLASSIVLFGGKLTTRKIVGLIFGLVAIYLLR